MTPTTSGAGGAELDAAALARFDGDSCHFYLRRECAVFRKTSDPFGGLSNMAAGFPLNVDGIAIRTCEALYQACRFPHLPLVQQEIIAQASPMAAKMKSKPHRAQSRSDFDELRVPIMWWALRVKLACNPSTFGRLLTSTSGLAIVEDSHKDTYWGAVPDRHDSTVLRGRNVLGRLLVLLRELVDTVDADLWQTAPPPPVPGFRLLGPPIGTAGPRTAVAHSLRGKRIRTKAAPRDDDGQRQ